VWGGGAKKNSRGAGEVRPPQSARPPYAHVCCAVLMVIWYFGILVISFLSSSEGPETIIRTTFRL
jgi:hypothetical protein